MPNCAVVGINWGDEGKGRMVDLLTKEFDIVIRYQGGGNAGHTVVNEYGEFALHLLRERGPRRRQSIREIRPASAAFGHLS